MGEGVGGRGGAGITYSTSKDCEEVFMGGGGTTRSCGTICKAVFGGGDQTNTRGAHVFGNELKDSWYHAASKLQSPDIGARAAATRVERSKRKIRYIFWPIILALIFFSS